MLVKIGDTKIVVSAIVVVNQDDTSNFTTIGEAVAATPKNNKPNTGYFGIHIVNEKYNE